MFFRLAKGILRNLRDPVCAVLFAAAALLAHHAGAQQCAPDDGPCKCAASGHQWLQSVNACIFSSAHQVVNGTDNAAFGNCRIGQSALTQRNCADVFGPNFDFPTRPGNYYYNCDPDGTRGMIPATANTSQATACQCANPLKTLVGAQTQGDTTLYNNAACQCVAPYRNNADGTDCILQCPSPKVANADQTECICPPNTLANTDGTCSPCADDDHKCICESSGWIYGNLPLPPEDDPVFACFAPRPDIKFYGSASGRIGGGSTNFCLFSDPERPDRPLCPDIFGAKHHYPTKPGNYHFNCDPDGTRGLIPATANTTGATDCRCENPGENLIGAKQHPSLAGLTDYGAARCECEYPKIPNLPANTECVCPSNYRALGDNCIPADEDFGDSYYDEDEVLRRYLCRAFGGRVEPGRVSELEHVCSEMDQHDTFCIFKSPNAIAPGAFPCRGLFKHVRACNLLYNRPAFNMFFCAEKCEPGQTAIGAECR